MFSYCSNLTNIDLSSFDTKNVTNMCSMFSGCFNLKRVKINNISSNIIELLKYTNVNNMDQFGNNISKNNYLNNNNQNNYFNNNYIMNNINNNNFNNNMMNNNMNNNNMNNNNINYNSMINNNNQNNNMMNNNII